MFLNRILTSLCFLHFSKGLVSPGWKFPLETLERSGLTGLSSDPSCTTSITKSQQKRIPGTNLFTGVYYTISNKLMPKGSLVWTNTSRDYVRHLVSSESESSFKDWGYHWKFNPTDPDEQTDYKDWYEWINRAVPDGITSYGYEKVGNGYQISVISGGFKCKFQPGREFRQLALFKPKKQKGRTNEYYEIINGVVGQLTWGWIDGEKSDIRYIQADDGDGKYSLDETLFKFTPVNVKMSGKISKLAFKTTWNLAENTVKNETIRRILKNPTNKEKMFQISQRISGVNRFAFAFTEDISKVLGNLTMNLESPEFGDEVFPLPILLDVVNNSASYSEPRKLLIKTRVEVPPLSEVGFVAYVEQVKDVFVPFEAVLEVVGEVDSDQDGGNRAPAEFLLEELKSRGFYGDVMTALGNTLELRVSGGLKADFGHNGYFHVGAVKYTKRWRKPKQIQNMSLLN